MKKILSYVTVLLAAVTISLPLLSAPALAQTTPPAGGTTNSSTDVTHADDPAQLSGNCHKITSCNLIKDYLQPALDFLAAFVGVAVVIAIIYGGVEYGSSGGDPQKAASGKNRIKNAIIALLMFFFFYSFLKFILLPGVV